MRTLGTLLRKKNSRFQYAHERESGALRTAIAQVGGEDLWDDGEMRTLGVRILVGRTNGIASVVKRSGTRCDHGEYGERSGSQREGRSKKIRPIHVDRGRGCFFHNFFHR